MFNIEIPTIDLAFFKNWLRIDHDLDDLELNLCLAAAKSNIENTIGTKIEKNTDPELLIVVLNLATYYYHNKTMSTDKKFVPDKIYQSIINLHNGGVLW